MKLNIGKPETKPEVETVAEVKAGPTVEDKPKSGLAAMLAKKKEAQSAEPSKDEIAEEKPAGESKLTGLLAKAPAAKEKQAQNKIELADKSEKYVLQAEASDKLSQEVLDLYAAKMQHIINCMGTVQLQNALHDVLKYCEEHPHLRDIIRGHDVQTIVRASRQSYGLVLHSKTTNSNTSKKKTAEIKDLVSELADMDFGF